MRFVYVVETKEDGVTGVFGSLSRAVKEACLACDRDLDAVSKRVKQEYSSYNKVYLYVGFVDNYHGETGATIYQHQVL